MLQPPNFSFYNINQFELVEELTSSSLSGADRVSKLGKCNALPMKIATKKAVVPVSSFFCRDKLSYIYSKFGNKACCNVWITLRFIASLDEHTSLSYIPFSCSLMALKPS